LQSRLEHRKTGCRNGVTDVNLTEIIWRYGARMAVHRLSGLDMLRGIAAIIVAFNHAADLAGMPSFFNRSYLAVDFFFLLSGFVIAATFEARMSALGAARFLQARWFRLLPMIAIGVAMSATIYLASGADPYLTAVCAGLALAFLPMSNGIFYLNNPMWSVHFELVANAAHMIFLRRIPSVGLLLIAVGCLATLVWANGWRDLDVGQGDSYFLGIPRVLLSYALGVLLWRINAAKARGPAWLAFMLLPLAILTASQLGWADYIVVLLVNPIILLCGLGFDEDSAYRPVAHFIGAWSFPLYALHWPVQDAILRSGQSWLAAFAWSIGVSLAVGVLLDQRVRAASLASFGWKMAWLRQRS